MTTTEPAAHPKVVSRDEWLAARKTFLLEEKELKHQEDAVAAARRRLPMVRIDKPYTFEGPSGRVSLLDLFGGRRQLIVYHFMFDPGDPPAGKSGAPWEEGCPGCSYVADNFPHPAHLNARDTSFVVTSRAPLAKISPFKARMGWTFPWYSSFGTDFNYDFHVTTNEAVRPVEYNYQDKATLLEKGETYHIEGEQPGLSVFLRARISGVEGVFHTYSTYGRGLEALLTTFRMLDLTPLGRQEDWEDSPPGWPQTETFPGWIRHHDKYDNGNEPPCCQPSHEHA